MIVVLTDPGIGGTFLTWTLFYLSGKNDYYLAKQKKRIELVSDPLCITNAHNFIPNQPQSLEKFHSIFDNLSTDCNDFNVLYFHNFSDCNGTFNGTTSIAIDYVAKKCKKIVQLSIAKKNSLYHCTYNKRHLPNNIQQKNHEHFIEEYFKDSNQQWNNLNLTNVWDHREFLALNFFHHDFTKITDVHNFEFEHYCLDATDLWTMFDHTVIKLFKYLNLLIDHTRWDHWADVYSKWKKIHYQSIQFDLYFDKIINYIITGKNFNLQSFDLDIMQEAAIQHTLIYKHNLNLKNWQLEKFTNTQQLHSLLEPNIHKI